jgi:hypothetical protein
MIPSDIDLVTASVRWFTSSFWKMLATWGFTLLSLMERAAAMALLGEPLAMSCKTLVPRSDSNCVHYLILFRAFFCAPSMPEDFIVSFSLNQSQNY